MLALRPLISALIVVSSATPLIGAPDAAGNFRAAVATVDITPSANKWLAGYPARKSTGVAPSCAALASRASTQSTT